MHGVWHEDPFSNSDRMKRMGRISALGKNLPGTKSQWHLCHLCLSLEVYVAQKDISKHCANSLHMDRFHSAA